MSGLSEMLNNEAHREVWASKGISTDMTDVQDKTPRERAWQVMVSKRFFTVSQVAELAVVPKQTVSTFVQFLLRQERVKTLRATRPYRFKVTNAEGLSFGQGQRAGKGVRRHRKANKPRQQMWNTMRVLRKFSVMDLMMAAEVKRVAAHGYISLLLKAGYVRKLCAGGNRKGERAMYLMLRNTGPKSPTEKRGEGGMWDVNEQQLYPFKEKAND